MCVCVCVCVRVSYNGRRWMFQAFFFMPVFNIITQVSFGKKKTLSFEQPTAKSLYIY